jgi:hypothetical protein
VLGWRSRIDGRVHGVAVAIQGGQRFDVTTTLKADLMAKFPDETTAIEAYFEAVRQEQAAAGPFFVGMLLSCLLPTGLGGWMWSKLGSQHMKISDQTVATALGRLTSNAELRGLLAYHYGNYGLPPSEASFAIHGMVSCFPFVSPQFSPRRGNAGVYTRARQINLPNRTKSCPHP